MTSIAEREPRSCDMSWKS